MKCNECEMVSIDGIPCHESGCPNSSARWDGDDWIQQRKCFTCGYTVDRDDDCCDAEESDDDN